MKSGQGLYGSEGSPGHLRMVAGELVCAADSKLSDAMRDEREAAHQDIKTESKMPGGTNVDRRHREQRVAQRTLRLFSARYAKVCTITGPAIAVADSVSRGARFCLIHGSARLFDSSAPA